MTAPMSEHQFRRLVAKYGCQIQATGSGEWKVVKEGKTICFIAISHGNKREVKPVYIKRFKKALEQLDD